MQTTESAHLEPLDFSDAAKTAAMDQWSAARNSVAAILDERGISEAAASFLEYDRGDDSQPVVIREVVTSSRDGDRELDPLATIIGERWLVGFEQIKTDTQGEYVGKSWKYTPVAEGLPLEQRRVTIDGSATGMLIRLITTPGPNVDVFKVYDAFSEDDARLVGGLTAKLLNIRRSHYYLRTMVNADLHSTGAIVF